MIFAPELIEGGAAVAETVGPEIAEEGTSIASRIYNFADKAISHINTTTNKVNTLQTSYGNLKSALVGPKSEVTQEKLVGEAPHVSNEQMIGSQLNVNVDEKELSQNKIDNFYNSMTDRNKSPYSQYLQLKSKYQQMNAKFS